MAAGFTSVTLALYFRTREHITTVYTINMKAELRKQAILLREQGYAINYIAMQLGVAKSSVSVWVRNVALTESQKLELNKSAYSTQAIERRRVSRLANEFSKRQKIIDMAFSEVTDITLRELWLMGVMLYWAEGGKTQRMFRFSNGDPEMISIMMNFLRLICKVDESKLRGYIHIHPHLDHVLAEKYWSDISQIPNHQFFKTYRKPNKGSAYKGRDTLPFGVFDIYVMDTRLFLKVSGWAQGIFASQKELR